MTAAAGTTGCGDAARHRLCGGEPRLRRRLARPLAARLAGRRHRSSRPGGAGRRWALAGGTDAPAALRGAAAHHGAGAGHRERRHAARPLVSRHPAAVAGAAAPDDVAARRRARPPGPGLRDRPCSLWDRPAARRHRVAHLAAACRRDPAADRDHRSSPTSRAVPRPCRRAPGCSTSAWRWSWPAPSPARAWAT